MKNLEIVRERIAEAAKGSGRRPEEITLVCVTKEVGLQRLREVIDCGVRDIGESRIQEALRKYNQLLTSGCQLSTIKWHMVGHLQTNKVRDAVRVFDLIHSVDSLRLAHILQKQAAKINKTVDILIQVNTSGEKTKFGLPPDKLKELIKEVVNLEHVRLKGLMTIAPMVADSEKVRPYFRNLRLLQEEINESLLSNTNYKLSILSMGMSQDYRIAIQEGANMVRIGRAIFKDN